jgi:nucleotide-binding universal stress UspA family protein
MPIEPMDPVVAGVDGSVLSLAAIELAADEAVARMTPLVVVHAYGDTAGPAVAGLLDTAVATARSIHPGLSVRAEAVPGPAAEVLVDAARSASLVVIGHRGHGGARDRSAGSVGLRVAGRAEAPVLVYRPTDTSTDVALPRPVLLGISAGGSQDQMVEFAFAEAWQRGAPLHAMHVWSVATDPEGYVVRGFEQAQQKADRLLVETLLAWSGKYPDVVVHRILRHGLDAAVTLTAASRSAQLVVVGCAHAHGRFGLLASSVVGTLLERGGCPVAVIGDAR